MPSTSQYGQPVVLVANVTTTPASPRGSGPTGTVEFWLGPVPTAYATTPAAPGTAGLLGSANVNQRGKATLSNEYSPLPAGADTIYAVYYSSNPSNFADSQGSAAVTVGTAATKTIVYESPNPGVLGSSVTFTAVVSDAAPNWMKNGGTITPPSGTVSFLVNGYTETTANGVTFVGDSGTSAIYTYTTTPTATTSTGATQTAPLTEGTNSVTASFVATPGSNYGGSSSQNNTNYQVVPSAGTGTITAAGATTGSPASFKSGQTLSLYYLSGNTSTTTPNALTYTDKANGIDLVGTVTSFVVVFGSNNEAEISGTGTNTNGTTVTPVNFTLFVNASSSGGWSHNPNVVVNIVGNQSVNAATGTGFYYSEAASLASGSTITVTESNGVTLPRNGGLPSDQVMGSWPAGGNNFGGGGGFAWGLFGRRW